MPTVLEIEGFRFFFYSGDRNEPPHIHVRRAGNEAKFWLNPMRSATVGRFKPAELRRIMDIIEVNEDYFLEQWHGRFNR
jgi:hypothetical protein